MRKIRDILRLAWGEGLSHRQVGRALAIPFTTVADHVRRARAAGLSWPLPADLDDAVADRGDSPESITENPQLSRGR